MSIRADIRQIRVDRKKCREFGAAGCVLLLLAALVSWVRQGPHTLFFSQAAFAAGACALLAPQVLGPVYFVLMVVATMIGFVMSRVILVVLYVLVIIPIGVIGRLSGTVFLDRRFRDGKSTYWVPRTQPSDTKACERQF